MKTHLRRAGFAIALLGTVAVSTAAVRASGVFLPESRIWIEGTSSVRSYSCQAAAVLGAVEVDGPALNVAALEGAVKGAEVAVEVAGLDCGNGTMNGHMRKALKANEHGTIRFRLQDYSAAAAGSEAQVKIDGVLEIAGKEQPISVEGVATEAPAGALRVKGSHTINMTDFGVKPPSLMLGTMKVHDPVKLNFDLVVKP